MTTGRINQVAILAAPWRPPRRPPSRPPMRGPGPGPSRGRRGAISFCADRPGPGRAPPGARPGTLAPVSAPSSRGSSVRLPGTRSVPKGSPAPACAESEGLSAARPVARAGRPALHPSPEGEGDEPSGGPRRELRANVFASRIGTSSHTFAPAEAGACRLRGSDRRSPGRRSRDRRSDSGGRSRQRMIASRGMPRRGPLRAPASALRAAPPLTGSYWARADLGGPGGAPRGSARTRGGRVAPS